MKIEQVLVHYLLKTKQLTLQGIGIFHLDASVPTSADPDKPVIIPDNAITFQYDSRAKEDEGLVDFIVEHTRKIKPLAASDLDSYLSLGRQFLNIGNPLVLPGIGTLDKLNSGVLAFKPGSLTAEKLEPNKIKNDEDRTISAEEENLFNDYQKERKSKNGGKSVLIVLMIIILGFIGWAVWHYALSPKNESNNVTSTDQIVPEKDSSFKADSQIIARSQTDSLNKQNRGDSVHFNIVVNEYYTPAAAEKRLEKLKNYRRNVIMYTNDSVIYKIAEPFMLPLSDTTRILDSFKRYYAKTRVEISK
ncbi:MAG TPA: hypothetical protein VIJ57_07595 [Hanamia sp.]